MTADLLRKCDVRLGDRITATVQGVRIEGVIVGVTAGYAVVAGSGYEFIPNRGPVPKVGGHIPVGIHAELEEVRAPQSAAELAEWLERPLIPCRICHR